MAQEFNYTYSAKDSNEAEKILKRYTPQTVQESNMERLRKLDASAATAGRGIVITIGTISALLLGVGMCCTMLWADNYFVIGIVAGLLGIFGCCITFPIYKSITKKQREKIAPEIRRLSSEIMGKK